MVKHAKVQTLRGPVAIAHGRPYVGPRNIPQYPLICANQVRLLAFTSCQSSLLKLAHDHGSASDDVSRTRIFRKLLRADLDVKRTCLRYPPQMVRDPSFIKDGERYSDLSLTEHAHVRVKRSVRSADRFLISKGTKMLMLLVRSTTAFPSMYYRAPPCCLTAR